MPAYFHISLLPVTQPTPSLVPLINTRETTETGEEAEFLGEGQADAEQDAVAEEDGHEDLGGAVGFEGIGVGGGALKVFSAKGWGWGWSWS